MQDRTGQSLARFVGGIKTMVVPWGAMLRALVTAALCGAVPVGVFAATSLLVADGVALPVGHVHSSQHRTINLPYFTSNSFDIISPSNNGNNIPLVIMLSGYCLPAKQQDDVSAAQPVQMQLLTRLFVPPQMQLQYAKHVDEKRFHYVMLKSARSTRNCSLCPTSIRAANAAGDMPFYAAGAALTQALTAAGLCTAWDATPACCINENAGRNGGDTGYIKSVIAAVSSAVAVDSKARACTPAWLGLTTALTA